MGQFFPCKHTATEVIFLIVASPYPRGAMALYQTHFSISTGNFYVNLNSSGAAILRRFFL
jgi:hypothetical protein